MTITTEQADLAAALRRDGASALETAIVLSVVELSDHWMHELRGPDGKWAKGPSAWEQRVSASAHMTATFPVDVEAIHQRAVAEATALAREHAVKHIAETTTKVRAETHAKTQALTEKHGKDIHVMMDSIRRANQRLQEAADKDESKKSRIKLAIHLGAILAGAIVAYLEARFGLGFVHSENLRSLIELGSGAAPLIAQETADWKKRL